MTTSVSDLFSIGIGPSSSHTVGPMRAANAFAALLRDSGRTAQVATVTVHLHGSLAATGRGHGTIRAVTLGLRGHRPETVDPDRAHAAIERELAAGHLRFDDDHDVPWDEDRDVVLHLDRLPFHANGLVFVARDAAGRSLLERTWYSVGGGFVVDEDEAAGGPRADAVTVPFPFASGDDLVRTAEEHGLRISDVVLANECATRSEGDVRVAVLGIWAAMRDCIAAGCATEGELPGGLHVRRRAAALAARIAAADALDPLVAVDRVTVAALAVNEQNAAGGRIVTAPTNGAAGIIPAVLEHWTRTRGADDDGVVRFLLAATAVGSIIAANASISGAEVGCQGEVGSACAMAAAGLTEALGGTPAQVEAAAEIGLEHNLGLTCDPIGGLVQIPCIERNAVGAVQAIAASRMALGGDGRHVVSLDQAIDTMRRTGADMHAKYKETAQGGLALTVAQVEC